IALSADPRDQPELGPEPVFAALTGLQPERNRTYTSDRRHPDSQPESGQRDPISVSAGGEPPVAREFRPFHPGAGVLQPGWQRSGRGPQLAEQLRTAELHLGFAGQSPGQVWRETAGAD